MADKPIKSDDLYIELMKGLIKDPDLESMMDKDIKTGLLKAILKQEKQK